MLLNCNPFPEALFNLKRKRRWYSGPLHERGRLKLPGKISRSIGNLIHTVFFLFICFLRCTCLPLESKIFTIFPLYFVYNVSALDDVLDPDFTRLLSSSSTNSSWLLKDPNVLPLENKIHIFAPPCNILYLFLNFYTLWKQMIAKIIGVTHIFYQERMYFILSRFYISTALTQLLQSRLEDPGPQHQEQAINNEHIISILKILWLLSLNSCYHYRFRQVDQPLWAYEESTLPGWIILTKQLLRQSPQDSEYSSSTFKAMTCSILFRAILHGWHMWHQKRSFSFQRF